MMILSCHFLILKQSLLVSEDDTVTQMFAHAGKSICNILHYKNMSVTKELPSPEFRLLAMNLIDHFTKKQDSPICRTPNPL